MPQKDPKYPLGMTITGSHPQPDGTILIKQSVYSDDPSFYVESARKVAIDQRVMQVLSKEQYKDEEVRKSESHNWSPELISPVRTTGFGEYEALYSVKKTN